ncbi:two-component sensor histidine kinase [Methylomonas lenta]|uniref:histidine kinase n=1 Tax=Methylomonas lenta TaxID=980561 RepID=A0A177NTM6_9GAMM|nr:ATP-binding protein [Methylomonas lenta]OAI20904.1 two-component sensor histidine kinase [Methylomonas lenta]
MRQLLFRPIIFVTLIMGLLVLGELLAIGRLTWLNDQRIHTIQTDLGKGHHLQQTIFELLQLQSTLAAHQNDPSVNNEQITELQSHLLDLLQNHNSADFSVPLDLHSLQAKFAKAIQGDSQALVDTMNLIQDLLDQQTDEEEKLLINVEDDSKLELQLAIILPLLLFWIGHYFFRNNVLEPLDALRMLLSGLAEGVKQPINYKTADPILSDLFERYNHLVAHLIELEQSHLNYTSHLESQVRKTSHALLEQSQRLAKAERLAALTEMAASTAHELRNPLAIIQVALENIQSESSDPELRERIGLLHREVHRLTKHLNDLLSSARNSNETAQTIDIHQVAQELLTLLSYQVNENVQFEIHSQANMFALLPETEFRQVLLNLLQNAVQAIGDQPGKVQVDIKQEQQQLIVTVSDSGGGFNPELLQQGIRPFVSLKVKGSGLGLVMVQRFIREQRGNLKLENNSAGHASISLSLPLNPA